MRSLCLANLIAKQQGLIMSPPARDIHPRSSRAQRHKADISNLILFLSISTHISNSLSPPSPLPRCHYEEDVDRPSTLHKVAGHFHHSDRSRHPFRQTPFLTLNSFRKPSLVYSSAKESPSDTESQRKTSFEGSTLHQIDLSPSRRHSFVGVLFTCCLISSDH